MTQRKVLLIVLLAVAVLPAWPVAAQQDFGLDNVILDTTSLWRYRMVWETEEIQLPSGQVDHFVFTRDRRTNEVSWPKADPVVVLPDDTPPDWFKPDFDDSAWGRFRGPWDSYDIGIKNLMVRGRLDIPNLEMAGDMEVQFAFYGGAVVYVNGEEVGRAFMPEGKIDRSTCATPYPIEAYVGPEGFILSRYEARKYADRFKSRTRTAKFKVPWGRLVQGANVLAVDVHRPACHHVFYDHRIKAYAENGVQSADSIWGRLALTQIQLLAPPGSSARQAYSRPKDVLFQVWNQGIGSKIWAADYAEVAKPLAPVRIAGPRNGLMSGQVVVASPEPILGLKVEKSDLAGPAGTLPASAIELRFGLPDGSDRRGDGKVNVGVPFDSLDDTVPAEAPVRQDGAGAVVPIWVNVAIPADAKPGQYAGKLTVSAAGLDPIELPLQVRVIDWLMPDTRDFVVRPDIVQSPETVAMRYGVPLWSDAHWALLDRTFRQLGRMAVKSLYVTCIRRTHYGNEHGMIRWVRQPDGRLAPDFSIAEKYLDTAIEYMGARPTVVLYCWEPPDSAGHAGFGPGRTHDRDILISVLDPDTGLLSKEVGPKWGSRECRQFWTDLVDGWRKVLEKRGMAGSMAFGMVGDHRPTKQAMDDVCATVPKARWAVHSHYYCDNWQGYPAAFCAAVWGIGARVAEPEDARGYGWMNPYWLMSYPRVFHPGTPLGNYRTYTEMYTGAIPGDYHYWRAEDKAKGTRGIKGVGGIGRVGGDFWNCIRDSRGNFRSPIAGRYPETAWGQLNITYGISHVLGPGAKGPVATYRSESYRLNFQEIEARAFIEKALLDAGQRARLGDELAARAQALLDERIRFCNRANQLNGWAWQLGCGWAARCAKLYDLAAEVAAKLAK